MTFPKGDDDRMDQESLNRYRDSRLKLREDLRGTISQLRTTTGPVAPDRAIGRLTRMEALQSQTGTITCQEFCSVLIDSGIHLRTLSSPVEYGKRSGRRR